MIHFVSNPYSLGITVE